MSSHHNNHDNDSDDNTAGITFNMISMSIDKRWQPINELDFFTTYCCMNAAVRQPLLSKPIVSI